MLLLLLLITDRYGVDDQCNKEYNDNNDDKHQTLPLVVVPYEQFA